MLRSAAIASARAAVRLVAASSRPSVLHRPITSTDPTVRRELLLTLNSVPRLNLDFSRSYAGGGSVGYEDEDEDTDVEDPEALEALDDDDSDEDDHEFDDDEDAAETSD